MKKKFEILFTGKKTIEAYTESEAIAKLEQMKNVKTEIPIKIQPWYDRLAYNMTINIGAIICMLVGIMFISCWAIIIDKVMNLDKEFALIGMMIFFVFLMTTIKFPKVIGGWFGKIK